ncbi:hypothetical protein RUM43_003386 [Polyplax serrata]|uniref:Uncharacterized protein n=1 Tax=Polyplax serrata TaxID=468196 RepID=A0AAN8P010_POLSC
MNHFQQISLNCVLALTTIRVQYAPENDTKKLQVFPEMKNSPPLKFNKKVYLKITGLNLDAGVAVEVHKSPQLIDRMGQREIAVVWCSCCRMMCTFEPGEWQCIKGAQN